MSITQQQPIIDATSYASGVITITDGSGLQVEEFVGNALLSLCVDFSGPSAPTPTYPLMKWNDTTNMLLKQRDSTNASWITIGNLDSAYWGLSNNWVASTAYTVGQICYLSAYPYIMLECVAVTGDGKTGTTEPSSFTVGSNLTDNNVTWLVKDSRNISPALALNNVTITNTSTIITLASGALIGLRNSAGTRIINILTSADITLTPTLAASTAYYLWLVHTASTNTTALILTTTTTAPSYDYYRYLGGRFTNSNSLLYIIKQVGNECQYVVDGTILTDLLTLAIGITSSTPTSVSLSGFIPTTAAKIALRIYSNSNQATVVQVGPNSTYYKLFYVSNNNAGGLNIATILKFTLESMYIYWTSGASSAELKIASWEENL
jgi:hypothetical protein